MKSVDQLRAIGEITAILCEHDKIMGSIHWAGIEYKCVSNSDLTPIHKFRELTFLTSKHELEKAALGHKITLSMYVEYKGHTFQLKEWNP